jgi:hypothetical protein
MKKYYELVIGTDRMPFFAHECDQDGVLSNPNMENLDYAFSNNAKVIDVTDLEYVPQRNTTYNAETNEFIYMAGTTPEPLPENLIGTRRFSYVVDGVVYGTSILKEDNGGPMSALIAALSSDPVIRFDRIA